MSEPHPSRTISEGDALAERLERGDLVLLPTCPFPLADADDLAFLLSQRLHDRAKSISLLPDTGQVEGHRRGTPAAERRLRSLMTAMSRSARRRLAWALPCYAQTARPGPFRFRPAEEDGREISLKYTGALLHVDAFYGDSVACGESSLRLFVNVNPAQERVWHTSHTLSELLDRYGDRIRTADDHPPSALRRAVYRLRRAFGAVGRGTTVYDEYLHRLHGFLKTDEYMLQQAPRREWVFPPGSAWLVFSDLVSHAVIRGQFAVDQTMFIPAGAFRDPRRSTKALLERAWRR